MQQFCKDCGKPLASGTKFCGDCGAVIAESSSASAPTPSVVPGPVQQPTALSESATANFIGPKYRYYEAKWATPQFRENAQSWNWAAFFGCGLWLAYRKMYAYAWGMVGLQIITNLCIAMIHVDHVLFIAWRVAIALVIGTMGNFIYRFHIDKQAAEIVATKTADNAQAELVRRGGTSVVAVFVFLVLSVGIEYVFIRLG